MYLCMYGCLTQFNTHTHICCYTNTHNTAHKHTDAIVQALHYFTAAAPQLFTQTRHTCTACSPLPVPALLLLARLGRSAVENIYTLHTYICTILDRACKRQKKWSENDQELIRPAVMRLFFSNHFIYVAYQVNFLYYSNKFLETHNGQSHALPRHYSKKKRPTKPSLLAQRSRYLIFFLILIAN